MQVNMLEAKNQLSRLVKAAQRGEDVIIARSGQPVARIVPIGKAGGLKGWGRLRRVKGIDAAFTARTEAKVARILTGER